MPNTLVALFGAFTSIVTAVVLALVEVNAGFAFYSLMFLFIIPIGAFSSGVAASSGYYFGARLLNLKPTRFMNLSIIVVSVGTYFLLNFLEYRFSVVDGQHATNLVTFPQFLDITIRYTSIAAYRYSESSPLTGTLGGWGYVIAVLQTVGFATGGVAVTEMLVSSPYCDKCKKYFKKRWEQARYFDDEKQLEVHYQQVAPLLLSGADQQAVSLQATSGRDRSTRVNRFRSKLRLRQCPKCGRHEITYVIARNQGGSWRDVSGTKRVTQGVGPVSLPER